jgi:hypothetical protein
VYFPRFGWELNFLRKLVSLSILAMGIRKQQRCSPFASNQYICLLYKLPVVSIGDGSVIHVFLNVTLSKKGSRSRIPLLP